MATRSPWDYPWLVPLHDGLIGPEGFAACLPWLARGRVVSQPRIPVLAIGSNASPEVLADKLAGVLAGAPDVPVVIEICVPSGLAVGHSAHISLPGYVAAAPFLVRSGGGDDASLAPQAAYSLGWFTGDQMAALDVTEPNYDRVALPPSIRVVSRSRNAWVSDVSVYRSRHGVLGDNGCAQPLQSQDDIHRWLALRLPHLVGQSDTLSYADPQARERVRVELIRHGLVVPSGLS